MSGSFLSGFMEVERKGLLRAGGAVAFFALVYLVNPANLVTEPEPSETVGSGVGDHGS